MHTPEKITHHKTIDGRIVMPPDGTKVWLGVGNEVVLRSVKWVEDRWYLFFRYPSGATTEWYHEGIFDATHHSDKGYPLGAMFPGRSDYLNYGKPRQD